MNLKKLTDGANVVRFLKAQKLKRLGHAVKMDENRMVRRTTDWKPLRKKAKENLGKDG